MKFYTRGSRLKKSKFLMLQDSRKKVQIQMKIYSLENMVFKRVAKCTES